MQVSYVNSLSLPKGFRVTQFEDKDIAAMCQDPVKLRQVTDACNKYARQKSALVDGRAALMAAIVAIGFVRPTETAKVDGEDVTTFVNTEGDDIKAFWNGLIDGSITNKAVTGKTPEEREKQADAFMQSLADTCGDEGTNPPSFVLDLAKAERAPGKPKNPPKFALDAAEKILAGPNVKAWIKKFTEGYTAPDGTKLPPVAFEPFDTKPAKDATPDAAAKVAETNKRNLAFAIAENENNRRELTKKQYE